MGREFDFSKNLIPTISLIIPGRGEVGNNIDRCIIIIIKLVLYLQIMGLLIFCMGIGDPSDISYCYKLTLMMVMKEAQLMTNKT